MPDDWSARDVHPHKKKRHLKETKSFGQFGERWLEKSKMADNTWAMRRAAFERDILPTFRNRLLTEINADDLRTMCGKVKERRLQRYMSGVLWS